MLGPCAGGAGFASAMADFIVRVSDSFEGETEPSNRVDLAYDDEETCLAGVRRLLSLLPQNNHEGSRVLPCYDIPTPSEVMRHMAPADGTDLCDVGAIVGELTDDGGYLPMRSHPTHGVIWALARLGGHVVGFVVDQPPLLEGPANAETCDVARRFVEFCDAFGIPLITLIDRSTDAAGTSHQYEDFRHGARLLYAYGKATTPRISLILRWPSADGRLPIVDDRSLGADLTYAWLAGAHAGTWAKPSSSLRATWRGFVDDVIDPAETRDVLIRSLAVLRSKEPTRL
ncbi:carboxyl transferase domain-containing protein [Streptomyces sp. NPDC059468]|uniref:carboxyl transferase domain-containing protein n=1 Tax=Streptomyces sp. NPDC059468 TaxID=3346845 RepID=UPI0036A85BF5